MEFHSLHQIVLGSLDDFQTATLQSIAEGHSRGLSSNKGHGLGFLRLITVNGLFCDGISARE